MCRIVLHIAAMERAFWIVLNTIQAIIIFLLTAVCAIIGITMRLVGFSPQTIILFLSRIMWTPIVCAVSFVRVKLHHANRIPRNKSVIFVANHTSQYDIVAMARVFPVALFYIAKIELRKVPFLGWYMIMIGHIFVDRKNKDRALQSLREAGEKIKQGKNVITFPEGTRSKTGELMLFRRGSFVISKESLVPIVPIAIFGAREVLSSGSMGLRPGTIHVVIGEEISVEQIQKLSVEELSDLARNRVQTMLSSFQTATAI
jgi:1-acyl-sn-glycerol-3-phosphate acyltransferase